MCVCVGGGGRAQPWLGGVAAALPALVRAATYLNKTPPNRTDQSHDFILYTWEGQSQVSNWEQKELPAPLPGWWGDQPLDGTLFMSCGIV